ncbi:MAG: hypothetical protein KJO38_03485 [Gammaproteobacteria bacterium]|nr:hypothetical protein [Gammaproteobacteria bacterium]
MKTSLIAIALVASSSTAAADGFAPWDDRAVVDDAGATVSNSTATSGFAPWNDRDVAASSADQDAVVETPVSVFRPWS